MSEGGSKRVSVGVEVTRHSDRFTSLVSLPPLRLWIMAIMAAFLFSSSSLFWSLASTWPFWTSREEACQERGRAGRKHPGLVWA